MSNLKITTMGRILYYLIPYRRAVIKANINQVFNDSLTPALKKHLMLAFYSHLATSIKEAIQLRFISDEALSQAVDVVGHENLLNVAKANKGVLILTAHMGNWEFAPLGGILNFKQYQGQFHFIRRTLGAKWLERILFRRYFRFGLNVIPKKNSLDKVCDALAQNHAVVFVLDQHASLVNRDGVAAEFFGKKAGTYRSLASLSGHTGVPVVPATSYRLPSGRHVLAFGEPIVWQDHGSLQATLYHNTLAYNQALEKIILAHPEQWMWLHKRWKL